MKELGVGIAGFGFIGRVHALGYHSLPFYYSPPPCKVKLVGVCTAREESWRRAVDELGFEFGTTDWRNLVSRDDIHIIDCCTPNVYHREIVLAALRAGKHVYCEKPLATNAIEAREMAVEAERLGLKNQVALQYRFIPAMLRAKQLIEQGFLGRLFTVRAAYLHSGYIDPSRPLSWRMTKAQGGGGALLDLGSHVLDLVTHLAGEFQELWAMTPTFIKERPVKAGSTEMAPMDVDDAAMVVLRSKDPDRFATIEATRFATGAQDEIRLELHGDRGALRFNSMDPNWLYAYDCRDPGEPLGGSRGFKAIETVQRYPKPSVLPGDKFTVGWMRYHFHAIHEFLRCIVEDRPCIPSFSEGARLQEMMDAVYRSAEEERWVALH